MTLNSMPSLPTASGTEVSSHPPSWRCHLQGTCCFQAREMTQQVKCLRTCVQICSVHIKPSLSTCLDSRDWGTGIDRGRWLLTTCFPAGLAKSMSARFIERQNKVETNWRRHSCLMASWLESSSVFLGRVWCSCFHILPIWKHLYLMSTCLSLIAWLRCCLISLACSYCELFFLRVNKPSLEEHWSCSSKSPLVFTFAEDSCLNWYLPRWLQNAFPNFFAAPVNQLAIGILLYARALSSH